MKLKSIHVENFRGFHGLNLDLNEKSVVLFGINGVGKSSVLAAVNYLFWSILYRLNNTQGTAFRSLNAEDVHAGCTSLSVSADVELHGNMFTLKKDYIKAKPGKAARTTANKEQYDSFLNTFTEAYLSETHPKNMPIFVSYGTNRSVLDIPLRIRGNHEFSQLTALGRSMDKGLDFRTFFEWFRNQEDLENEIKTEIKNWNYEDILLKCVRKAVRIMLGDVSDLRVKRNPLRMTVKKNQEEIRVDNLSDGEKCTLALFGDLARRVALANPYRENPLEGEGIVLVDEIELHMHPLWQRKVLKALKMAFPNIQFIITTHSPQVIGEVDSSYCLFGLKQEAGEIVTDSYGVYGWDSNGILQSVMDTAERSEEIKAEFGNFYKAIDQEDYITAKNILDMLEEMVAADDPELSACRIRLDLECR